MKRLEIVSGMRLGKRERYILLNAPTSLERPRYLPPQDDTEAARVAHLRAKARLKDLGLIDDFQSWYREIDRKEGRLHYGSNNFIQLTPFGTELRMLISDELATGTQIRWPRIVQRDAAQGFDERVESERDNPSLMTRECMRRDELISASLRNIEEWIADATVELDEFPHTYRDNHPEARHSAFNLLRHEIIQWQELHKRLTRRLDMHRCAYGLDQTARVGQNGGGNSGRPNSR
jgi:hypothetical protein